MENVKDWCISRQLWWGQRIPAWYNENDQWVVAKTKTEAEEQFRISGLNFKDLTQEEDVVDTWFSSWLWPISVFDGFKDPNNEDINYYSPTNDLVTAPEILFFWVARMIMAGHEFRGQVPFRNVYLTGIVRDKIGRKMSKSLGNSPDPLDLIQNYGADGVRIGMLRSSPAGNDLMFDEEHCVWGRNFANKIWNAFRLVKGWQADDSLPNTNETAIAWFDSRFNEALGEIESNFAQYRVSEALMSTYKLVWDDFCAWYLEMIKPEYQKPIDRETYDKTVAFFEDILKILHPFMPFITEELWHDENVFGERTELDCCIVAKMPEIGAIDTQLLKQTEMVKEVIAGVRNIRQGKQLSPKESLELHIKANSDIDYERFRGIIGRMANISALQLVNQKINAAASFRVANDELYIPLAINIDQTAEKERLEKEKEYLLGFLRSVDAKLGNERFVANAKPEIVQMEQKKKADALIKLEIIDRNLAGLAG
jgi:valyl-tRNA synthetase